LILALNEVLKKVNFMINYINIFVKYSGLVGRKGEEYRWEIQLSPDKSR